MAKIQVSNYEDNQKDLFQESLSNKDWLGIVVDNNDPLKVGRCKVRIFEKFDKLADDELPWAVPVSSPDFAGGSTKGYGSFSYPKKDTLVRVRFNLEDRYSPEYFVVQNINEKMQSEISGDYENCQVIRYDEDEDMKIIYTKNQGLMIWHKGSYVNIDKSKHIIIEHVGNPSIITLVDGKIVVQSTDNIYEKSPYIYMDSPKVHVGSGADQSITRCEDLMALLGQLAAIIDSKNIPNPKASQAVKAAKTICSKIAKVAP